MVSWRFHPVSRTRETDRVHNWAAHVVSSKGTDAMYNFVLKLNLATTEGKERFMRRWAVGRIANGEQPTPVEGWKFLQSLGIDVKSKKVRS